MDPKEHLTIKEFIHIFFNVSIENPTKFLVYLLAFYLFLSEAS